jgi:hypothetical protein
VRAARAWVLASSTLAVASDEACRAARALASASRVGFRSLLSPMVETRDVAVVGDGGAAAEGVVVGGGLGFMEVDGAAAGGVEDREERDTRLSRVSNPRITRPRLLRSS